MEACRCAGLRIWLPEMSFSTPPVLLRSAGEPEAETWLRRWDFRIGVMMAWIALPLSEKEFVDETRLMLTRSAVAIWWIDSPLRPLSVELVLAEESSRLSTLSLRERIMLALTEARRCSPVRDMLLESVLRPRTRGFCHLRFATVFNSALLVCATSSSTVCDAKALLPSWAPRIGLVTSTELPAERNEFMLFEGDM